MRAGFVFWVLGALWIGGCSDNEPITPAAPHITPVPAPAETTALARAEPADTAISGPIIVEHQVEIMAQRDGVLEKVFYDAPDQVKAGTVLAIMDDRQTEANLEAAKAKSRSIAADLKNWEAETEVLKADYVRAQHLWDLGLTSEEQLQHAKFKADSDQWDVERVKEMLNTAHHEERSLELEMEKGKITAPFDGVIARRYVREGQSVAKGERLFWVTAEAPLLMRFSLAERYFGRLHAGQQFEVTSPNVPGEKHDARVREISPVIDPSSGTFEVLVELSGPRGSLRPGMTANTKMPELH